MAIDISLLGDLFIALGIGALIGLQREQSVGSASFAGSRTLPLIALLGALNQAFFPSFLVLGFASVLVLVTCAYVAKVLVYSDPGLTTAVAALLTFFFGALTVVSDEARVFAVVFGTLTTAILALKPVLHSFAQRLTTDEVRAMLTFLVVALVVLPLLPNEALPFLLGLNPRFVWLMVVFVLGIDLAAYLLVKAFGNRGFLMAGAVGGLVSSTATTASMSTKTRKAPTLHRVAEMAIAIASGVMLLRILLVVGVVNTGLLSVLWPSIAAMAIVMLGTGWLLFRKPGKVPSNGTGLKNPFRLTPALIFGAFFAIVLLTTEWLHAQFGEAGIYGAAIVSGLVDVDAMTISLAQLSRAGTISQTAAVAGILLVSASNSVFKVALVWLLGTRRLAAAAAVTLGGAALVALTAAILRIAW